MRRAMWSVQAAELAAVAVSVGEWQQCPLFRRWVRGAEGKDFDLRINGDCENGAFGAVFLPFFLSQTPPRPSTIHIPCAVPASFPIPPPPLFSHFPPPVPPPPPPPFLLHLPHFPHFPKPRFGELVSSAAGSDIGGRPKGP